MFVRCTLLNCALFSSPLLIWLYNSVIEFWPSQPTPSIFLYPWARVFQFGSFNFCISFLTSSTHRVFGLPIGLLEMGFQEYIAFTILVPCILSMWPSQLSLCARMKFIMFLRFIISSSSWLVFVRHIPFSLFGLNIFLKIFLSNTISLLIMTVHCFTVGNLFLNCRPSWIIYQ